MDLSTTPRRKRNSKRITMPVKPRKVKPSPPTDDEWIAMESRSSVEVGGVTFREKDDVILHSREKNENAWVASLRQIRIRKDDECWIRVRWYQSPRNMAGIVDSFDPDMFCNMERAISDQSDILSAGCLKEVTRVLPFREESLQPLDIGPNNFFQRYSVGFESGDITPVPGSFTCLPECSRPYNPFPFVRTSGKRGRRKVLPDEIDLTWDVMHMCPRPQCKLRWYHRSCLVRAGYVEHDSSAYVGCRRARLLAVDPDSEDLHPSLADFTHLKSDHKLASIDQTQVPFEVKLDGNSSVLGFLPTFVSAKLQTLPPELVDIAARPIMRCPITPKSLSDPMLGAFSTAGNVKDIILARRLVYQALDSSNEEFESLCTKMSHSSDDQHLEPQARGSIRVFASPRHKYWRHIAGFSELEFLCDPDQCPPVICPQCKSAI